MRRRDNLSIFLLSGCMAVVVLAAVLIGYSFGASSVTVAAPSADTAALKIEEPEPSPTSALPDVQVIETPLPGGTIAIPGFERMTVEGRTLLGGAITNPANNNCYFIVSLMLADETEIYRSGILAPGQSVGAVELANPLAEFRTDDVNSRRYGKLFMQPAYSSNNLPGTYTGTVYFKINVEDD